MRLLVWLLLLPLALAAMAFAVANRAPVEVSFDPFPIVLRAPLYLVAFAALLLGVILGGIAARIAAWRRARAKAAEAKQAATQMLPSAAEADAAPSSALLPPPVG